MLNFFLPSLKLESKRREGSKTVRVYGRAQTPLERVLACPEVSPHKKAQLRALRTELNPFALRREVDRRLKEIDQQRELPGCSGWLGGRQRTERAVGGFGRRPSGGSAPR